MDTKNDLIKDNVRPLWNCQPKVAVTPGDIGAEYGNSTGKILFEHDARKQYKTAPFRW